MRSSVRAPAREAAGYPLGGERGDAAAPAHPTPAAAVAAVSGTPAPQRAAAVPLGQVAGIL